MLKEILKLKRSFNFVVKNTNKYPLKLQIFKIYQKIKDSLNFKNNLCLTKQNQSFHFFL